MGAKFVNVTVKGPSSDLIAAWLASERYCAIVGPTSDGLTTLFEKEIDTFAEPPMRRLATGLTRKFECTALGIFFYDDDVLRYDLYNCGVRKDTYDSAPDLFNDDAPNPPRPPQGGNARLLCEAFECPARVSQIESALHGNPGYPMPTLTFNTISGGIKSANRKVEDAYHRGPDHLKRAMEEVMPMLEEVSKHIHANLGLIQQRMGKDARERYSELSSALGLPNYGLYHGFGAGDLPDGFPSDQFIRVGL